MEFSVTIYGYNLMELNVHKYNVKSLFSWHLEEELHMYFSKYREMYVAK